MLKLIIIVFALILATCSIREFSALKTRVLQKEHAEMAAKLQSIDEKCDGIKRIEELLKRAIPQTAFENDAK